MRQGAVRYLCLFPGRGFLFFMKSFGFKHSLYPLMGQHRPDSHFVIRAVFCKKNLCFLFAAFKLRQKAFLYLFGNLNISVLHILRYFQRLFHRIGFAVFPVRPLFIRQRQAVPSLGKNMMGKGTPFSFKASANR